MTKIDKSSGLGKHVLMGNRKTIQARSPYVLLLERLVVTLLVGGRALTCWKRSRIKLPTDNQISSENGTLHKHFSPPYCIHHTEYVKTN